jgi:hypothetical protein
MEPVTQDVETILTSLQTIAVDWRDAVAVSVIEQLANFPEKLTYGREDIQTLLAGNFKQAKLIIRLFLGLTDDAFEDALTGTLGVGGTGIKRYRSKPEEYIDALVDLGILVAMAEEVNREPRWSDALVERLRSGRGSAITGQQRGQQLENEVRGIVSEVFPGVYDLNCNFKGMGERTAKCDVAIPNKERPRIIIESKAYGATGSKMSDVIGDIQKIIEVKRDDTSFLLLTDGTMWRRRRADMERIVEFQNEGKIMKIYTLSMAHQLRADLDQLRREYNIQVNAPKQP